MNLAELKHKLNKRKTQREGEKKWLWNMTYVLQGRETKPNKWLSSINAAGLHNGKAERTNMVKMELKPQVEDEKEMGRRQNAKDREFTHSFLRY